MMADEKKAEKKKKEAPPPKPRVPGEGDPFGPEATAFSLANRDGLGGLKPPAGITDATVIDRYQSVYLDEDEPWHATCRSVVTDAALLQCAPHHLPAASDLQALLRPTDARRSPDADRMLAPAPPPRSLQGFEAGERARGGGG